MRVLCFTVLIFILSSFCDGQIQQANVQIEGFSCLPMSIFPYKCNLCQCNFFGTSAHCVPAECPDEKPEPVSKPTPKPQKTHKLCTPGEKRKQKDGCNVCICTASILWACTKDNCTRLKNAIGSDRRLKRQYSYECQKTIEQTYWDCESKTAKPKKFKMNINHNAFFTKKWIDLNACDMKTSCELVQVRKTIKYPCPEGQDTLDLDDTEAKETPETTTSFLEVDNPTTVRNRETQSTEASNRLMTTTSSPEDIDSSVQSMSTTEAVTKDTDSVEDPREEIEASGDNFTPEEIDSDDFECQPNKSFKLECNTCWCRADGKGPRYCTRIACKPKTYRPLNQQ